MECKKFTGIRASLTELDSDVTTYASIISDADIIFDISSDVSTDANNDKDNRDKNTDRTLPLCLSNFKAGEALILFRMGRSKKASLTVFHL